MPQLVFVHGVATRSTVEYAVEVENRNKLFKELIFAGTDPEIQSPMWGNIIPAIEAGVFDTNRGVPSFDLNIRGLAGLGAGLTGGSNHNRVSIISVGQQDPTAALDAICSQIADAAASSGRGLQADELQAFRNAAAYIASNSEAAVFAGNVDQQSVSTRLTQGTPASYGVGSMVGRAISDVTDRIRNATSTLGFGAVRESLSPAVGSFMGDVFVYLTQGEHREKIRNVVREALLKAHEAKQSGKGPLILVGHSMGGVILVDMLTDPKAAGLPPDLKVDALFTVGSQPGLFASLGVLTMNAPPPTPYRKPDCITFWMNVFDAIDPLAFTVAGIYKGARDFVFNSVAGITDTHSKYFQRPQFYARARSRLRQARIL